MNWMWIQLITNHKKILWWYGTILSWQYQNSYFYFIIGIVKWWRIVCELGMFDRSNNAFSCLHSFSWLHWQAIILLPEQESSSFIFTILHKHEIMWEIFFIHPRWLMTSQTTLLILLLFSILAGHTSPTPPSSDFFTKRGFHLTKLLVQYSV